MGQVIKINELNAKLSDFDLFWEIYPRRQKKGDAVKAWAQTETIRPPIEEILAAIHQQQTTEQWRKDGGQFIPLPASWLRAWQWADE